MFRVHCLRWKGAFEVVETVCMLTGESSDEEDWDK